MNKLFQKEAFNYALWGAVFGLCFPIIATFIASLNNYGSISSGNLWKSQCQDPLLWIIDTAPFFLGLFAFFIGKQLDTVKAKSQEIIRTQQQLVLQEQLASIGKLTAGIAHEIKNPLNFVTNFAEASIELAEELKEAFQKMRDKISKEELEYLMEIIDDLVENSSDIRENGERANRIILTLMDHTRGAEGEQYLVNINQLVQENVNLAFHSYRASDPSFNVDIQLDLEPHLEQVVANPQSMGRVLLNIFNNACYAVNQKQKSSDNHYDPVLLIKTRQLPKELEVRIRDNGVGIPNEVRQKIFSPFYTTKPLGEGNTGLGLSISLDIIAQEHKGSLEVESEAGRFTEFIIRLPK